MGKYLKKLLHGNPITIGGEKMGMYKDTFDRSNHTAAKTNDDTVVVKAGTAVRQSEPRISDATESLLVDLFRLASAETRHRLVSESDAMDRAENGKIFRRVWVDKDDPEGGFIFTRMDKSEKDYITPEELEEEALEQWGIGGYISVYRLVENNDPLTLGRVATDDEIKGIITSESARKKKAREERENS